jgi:hypothetical protein
VPILCFSSPVVARHRPARRPPPRWRGGSLWSWCLLLLAAAASAAPVPLDLAKLCDEGTPLSPVGLDTLRGTLLFTVENVQRDLVAAPYWTLELLPGALTATAVPDQLRIGGSFGPGPVVAARRCGEGCLALDRWITGSSPAAGGAADAPGWQPVGPSLGLAATASFAATYDTGGRLWVVVLEAADQRGGTVAAARWLDGDRWVDAGRLGVVAVAAPAASPAPGQDDAILVGSGRFSTSAPPATWVGGLPAVAAERRGQLVAVGAAAAAYVAADGTVFLSEDRGSSWRQETWTPWRVGPVQVWQRGTDYSLDLAGGLRPPFRLPVLLFDQRQPHDPRLWLAGWRPGSGAGGWTVELELGAEVPLDRGGALPTNEVVQRREGDWLLLSGCLVTPAGSALVVREVVAGGVGAARLVPLRPLLAGASNAAGAASSPPGGGGGVR